MRKTPKTLSLHAFLTRLIWLCVLPLVLLAAYLAVNHVYTLQAQREEHAADRASDVATAIDRQIRERIAALQVMAASPLLDDPPRLNEFSHEAQAYRENFGAHVILADLSMQMLFYTHEPLGAALPKLPRPRGHAAAPTALETGKPAVGDMFMGAVAKEPLVAVAVQVIRDGRTRLLLLGIIETRQFQQRLDEIALPSGWQLTLLDGKNEVMARRSPPEMENRPADGEHSGRFVVKSAVSHWSVVLEIPRRVYLVSVVEEISALMAAILATTLIGILGGRLASRRLARAVAALAEEPPHKAPRPVITEIEAAGRLLVDAAAARDAAESTLLESERRFRQLFDIAPVPLCFFDKDGVLINFNARFRQTFGYNQKDVPTLAEWWQVAYPDPEYRRWVKDTWEAASTRASEEKTDIAPVEYQVTCKSGEVRTMVISGIRLGDNLLAVFFDITERKKAEQALQASYRFLQVAFHHREMPSLLEVFVREIKNYTGCAAVGIRILDEHHHIPYVSYDGFSRGFFELESPLSLMSDKCMCINVIKGEADPRLPFYTAGGSFYMNGTTRFLATVSEQEKGETRNECNRQGYESVALAPIRVSDQILGLIHVADPRENMVPLNVVEMLEKTGMQLGTAMMRNRAEEALRESEDRFRALVQNAADAIVSIDHQARVVLWNHAAEQIFGYSASEMIGKPITMIMPERFREAHTAALQRAGRTGKTSRHLTAEEVVGLRKDGEEFPAELSVSAATLMKGTLFTGVVRDTSERKRAQEDLLQSEDRYRSLFEESTDGVFVTTDDGLVLEGNRAVADMFGYTQEEFPGLNARDFYVDPSDRDKFRNAMRQAGSVRDYPVKLKRKDGKERDCLLSATLRLDRDGKTMTFQGVVRDVTEHLELSKQLQQAQKMEAVGTLAGGIAHDFNNLLQVILGYSELVLSEEDLPDHVRDDLGKILLAGRNGADLVQRLLMFSRKTGLKPLDLDLNQRLRQTQKFLQRTIPKMIEVELILAEDLARIHADPTQVDQVLMNLAVNARDAMPEGGKLVIETANVLLDEDYARSHLEAKSGMYVLLRVSDTGSGMDKETLEHVFEPFYTTKGPGEGTGLGLAMVFGIVKQHHGFINCYSEVGHGTTFKIYFSALVSDEKPEETPARVLPRGGSETILLVDDEKHILDLGSRLLTKAGYKVRAVSDAGEALKLYQTCKDEISLVILDLIMPKMGGRQCLESLLKLEPSVKVIIASGYAADAVTQEALTAGARGFVNKPYERLRLLETVRRVIDAE